MAVSKKKKADGRSKKRPGVAEQAEIIRAAAVALFVEQGTKNTSIAQICARADVSKPTFYRCFADKDVLVASLYEHSVNEHVDALMKATLGDDLQGKQMDTALDDLFDAIFSRADLAQLLFREYSDPDSPAATIIDDAFNRIARILETNFQSRFGSTPSRTFLKAMMSAFQWIAYDAIKKGLKPRHINDAKLAARELAAALFAGVKQEGSGGTFEP